MGRGTGACPHTVMLAVHCKKGEPVDVKGPVRQYVQALYGDHDAAECADDLEAMQGWRNSMVGQNASPESLRDMLGNYYKALCAMEARFPVSKDREHVQLSFSWYDAFKPTKKTTQTNMHLEKAATLFNVAAVHSQIAIAFDRSDPQGVKDACRCFQEAAGAFAFLKDNEALKVEHPRPMDLTPECTAMLEKLMLAQAQEIFYEKAVADGKSAPVVAKLGKQSAILYEEVFRALTTNAAMQAHFDKSWVSHSQGKSQYYDIQARYRQSLAHHEKDEIGLAIAYVRQALLIMGEAKKLAKAVHQDMAENLRILEQELMANLSKYERENNTVYLERVPQPEAVPPIVGAQLVKSAVPGCLGPEGGKQGKDLFSAVVPESSAKALSKYTDMVDTVCREQLDKLAASSDFARIKLREWELPDLLVALDGGGAAAGLPDNLRAELEEITEHGGSYAHLQDLSWQISDCRETALQGLAQAEETMNAEAAEDKQLREQYRERWTRPPSEQLTASLWQRIAGYRANLQQAGESDAKVQAKLQEAAPKLQAMTLESATRSMPRMQAPMVSTVDDAEPAAVVSNLRSALQQLDVIGAQRAALEESLKELKVKDNILPKLMNSADLDALFKAEIAKYDKLKEQVDKNCTVQGQLLTVMGNNARKFQELYAVDDWRRSCAAATDDVRKTMATYKEIRDNLGEGIRFYLQLQEVISTLVQHCGDFCLTRRIHRDDTLQHLNAHLNSLSLSDAPPGTPPPPPSHASAPPPPPPPQYQQYQQPPPPPPQYQQYQTYHNPYQQQQPGAPLPPPQAAYPPPQYPPPGYHQ